MKYHALVLALLLFVCSCGKDNNQTASKNTDSVIGKKETAKQVQNNSAADISKFAGTYVSGSYDKRSEGYDWVAVIVTKWGDSTLFIKVRSRTDQKKATCTYTAKAKMKSDNSFTGLYDGSGVKFSFANDSLVVSPETPGDESRPAYFCSGGGTLAGSYTKLASPLDISQMKPMSYSRIVSYRDMLYEVNSTENGSENTLEVKQIGAKDKNNEMTMKYKGIITGVEIGDLNKDTYPEVVIVTSSDDISRKGSILCFSSNSGKSLSITGNLPFDGNAEAVKGHRGQDEFAVVEDVLVQRFPVFDEGTPQNAAPVKMRQIQYKLIEGEAARQFKIDKITEF